MSAKQIARAIQENCEKYHVGTLGYDEWTTEQRRLWDHARTERKRVLALRALGFNA